MGFSFSNSTIETIKSQINIVDVVGRVVSLKRAGSNYKGVCPFHNEKTPSFVVSETKQIFTCFGCGASGDVIEFTKRHYNLDFSEAVEKLAGEYGIEVQKKTHNDNREIYYRANKMAAEFFYKAFTERANKGYAYMNRRGITPAILKKFGIGYADEKWDSLYQYLTSKGIDKKILLDLGLVSESSKGKIYDKFRNRVMFPIINTNGKVIGFGGRAINPDDNPKYLNSPESIIFQKKNNLYGLNISRQDVGKESFIILVEGYMDTIALYQGGVRNVAASLGTALTENQARLIKRYTKDVVLSYDADNAGRAAALRGLDILKKEDCKVKVLHVTDGKDPDEYIKKNGREAFLRLIDGALPYGDYKLEAAKKGYNLSKTESKIDYMKKAVEILRDLNPVEQDLYIKKLSKDISISESAIRRELEGKGGPLKANHFVHQEESKEPVGEILPLEKTLIKIMITQEAYIDRIRELPEILESDLSNKIYDLMENQYEKYGRVDLKLIMDDLSQNEVMVLQDISDNVVLAGQEEQIFEECIRTFKINRLEKKEEEIQVLLSLADEEDNADRASELTAELMNIQKERMKLKEY